MKFIGAILSLAALVFSAQAQAQTMTYQVSPLNIQSYAKVSLNTTFQFNLEENEAGIISKAEVDPRLGFSAAVGASLAPEFDAELEIASYAGGVDYRTIAGVPTAYIPEEELQLLALFVNGYYKFQPVANGRFKLGGGLGYGRYTLTDTNLLKHRGNGLVYQVKGVGEYDLTPRFTFAAEAGYIGTTDIDVDLSNSSVTRDTSLTGITVGVGTKVKF